MNLFQAIRTNIARLDPQSQRAYLRSKEQIYRELADLLISQGRLPEAQQVLGFIKEEEYREYLRGPSVDSIKRIELKTPGGEPSRPRGIAITPDGKYAAITGAPKGKPNSSVVWIVDLASYEVKGRVTEIGNESYMIGAFQAN